MNKVEVQLHTFLTLAIDKGVISFMAQQLQSRKRNPSIHWREGWMDPGQYGHCREDKNILPLPGIKPILQPSSI
jgi:hypothetical protein